jgi:hypothetical protein
MRSKVDGSLRLPRLDKLPAFSFVCFCRFGILRLSGRRLRSGPDFDPHRPGFLLNPGGTVRIRRLRSELSSAPDLPPPEALADPLFQQFVTPQSQLDEWQLRELPRASPLRPIRTEFCEIILPLVAKGVDCLSALYFALPSFIDTALAGTAAPRTIISECV